MNCALSNTVNMCSKIDELPIVLNLCFFYFLNVTHRVVFAVDFCFDELVSK